MVEQQRRFILKNTRLLVMTVMCFLFCSIDLLASAESNVELEWEAIENARKYDLEIKSIKNTFNFSVTKAEWAGKLSPGFFKMRIRARDKRNVPGAWSDYQEFSVSLDSPKFISPKNEADILSKNSDKQKIEITWQKVAFAKKYLLVVESLDGQFKQDFMTTKDRQTLEVPVATQFKASLKALSDDLSSNPEKDQAIQFTVIGKQLNAPTLQKIESLFVREMVWSPVDLAENYHYALERFDSKEKKYVVFDEDKSLKQTTKDFRKEWPGGNYKLTVKATAAYRVASDEVSIKFSAKNGDRSADAEELSRLRESIDRFLGWFTFGSYMITSVDYQSYNYDLTNSVLRFDAIGGTAKFGLGYVTSKKSWGYYGALEASHLSVNGFGEIKYSTVELSSIYKTRPSDEGEFRQTMGVVIKELPDLTRSFFGSTMNKSNLSALGLRYGVEYWHALTSKIGIQANAAVLPLLQKIDTTNGKPIKPTLSYQLGFLTSYRMSKNFTALMGYAYRHDELQYETSKTLNVFPASDRNSVLVDGHYVNILLEYQL